MMKYEFEEIAGYKVSNETYDKIIEPMYYAAGLAKQDFVKLLNRKALEEKEIRKPNIKKMRVRDRMGKSVTPNGALCYIEYVDMVDVDIETGKIMVAPLDNDTWEELAKTHDMDCSGSYDFDYMDCVDTKKKPIEINW